MAAPIWRAAATASASPPPAYGTHPYRRRRSSRSAPARSARSAASSTPARQACRPPTAVVDHPPHAVDVLGAGRRQVGIDRRRPACPRRRCSASGSCTCRRREVPDGRAHGARPAGPRRHRYGRRRCPCGCRSWPASRRAAAAAGPGSSARRRRPAAPRARHRSASGPWPGPFGANEHMPSTPASTMQATHQRRHRPEHVPAVLQQPRLRRAWAPELRLREVTMRQYPSSRSTTR